jgi:hypothetical protein
MVVRVRLIALGVGATTLALLLFTDVRSTGILIVLLMLGGGGLAAVIASETPDGES